MDSKYTGLIVRLVHTHTFDTDNTDTPTGDALLCLSAEGKLNYANFVTCLIAQCRSYCGLDIV